MATLASPLRAVLVDSRAERRPLMRLLLEGDGSRTSVVGEADSADAALVVVEAERADVAVVEIRMPEAEALRTVREISRLFPKVGIVVCSFDIDKATEMDALAEGAHVLLAKPASRHKMQAALDVALATALDAHSARATSAAMSP
jgi:DNA-binding NarL/FixJ family response regulator